MEHLCREAMAAEFPDIPSHPAADLLQQLVVEIVVATVQAGGGVPADTETRMNLPGIDVERPQVNDAEESLNEQDLIVECRVGRQLLPAIEAQQTVDAEVGAEVDIRPCLGRRKQAGVGRQVGCVGPDAVELEISLDVRLGTEETLPIRHSRQGKVRTFADRELAVGLDRVLGKKRTPAERRRDENHEP